MEGSHRGEAAAGSAGSVGEVVVPCGNCGAPQAPSFAVADLNRGIDTEQFDYLKCEGCGTFALQNVPDDLSRFYPTDYYELPRKDLLPSLAPNESHKIGMIAPWRSSGKLVEVGPGAGVFSFCAKQAGFDVTAIEMDERTCTHMRAAVGVDTVQSEEPAEVLRAIEPVSVVALWHVIEHLRDPWDFIDAAGASLESGGVLALSAPNPDSLQFRVMRGRWAHVDAPRHLFLIPLEAVAARAAKSGLRLAFVTTSDPSGRHWNRFGWEMALRGNRRTGPSSRLVSLASLGMTMAMMPVEATALRGATYSAVFVKDDGG